MKFDSLAKLKQKEIIEVLEKFGLSVKEQRLYFTLLNSGRVTISPLAKQLHCPISTTQAIIERLIKKGLIIISKNKSRHIYEAADPKELKIILERQIQEITNIIPFLNQLKSEVVSDPKVRVYYRERLADVFHEILESSDTIYEIVAALDLQAVLGEKFHFTRRRVAKKIPLKSLRVESREIKKYNKSIHERELREAKFLPAEMQFQASYFIWDDKVAIFSTKHEGLAVIIESKIINQSFRQFFEMFWSIGRRMETI